MQSASTSRLRIGTRGSPLARAQAEEVARRLQGVHGPDAFEIEIVPVSTAGDRTQKDNRPLHEIGGKGLFSKEIEERLKAGDIDMAVHSAKDMATLLPDGLIMPVFLPREDVRDAFISFTAETPEDLPEGAIVGTSSIRRRAQMQRLRPDIQVVEFRGNVGTRLEKLRNGVADATLLAAAGLKRTDMADKATSFLDPEQFPPAPAQGAIGIELREDDPHGFALVQPLNDPDTRAAIVAERAFLAELDGSCRTPVGVLSRHIGAQISLFGQILAPDGSEVYEAEVSGAAAESEGVGATLGQRLREMAGPAFIEKLKTWVS